MNPQLLDLKSVRAKELELIANRRKRIKRRICGKREEGNISVGSGLVGLALSGGGIRSAATSLGILQGLSKTRVLEFVDLLSTVSGGGYAGACLSSLLSLKKAGMHRRDTGAYSFAGEPDEPDEPAVFSTRWGAFPFRDSPECKKGTVHGTGSGPADSTFTGKDEMGHIRGRASFLVPRNRPFCFDVIKAFGATAVTTLVPLIATLLLLTTLTLFYMALSGPLVRNVVDRSGISVQTEEHGTPAETNGNPGIIIDIRVQTASAGNEEKSENVVWKTAKAPFLDFLPLVWQEDWVKFCLSFGFTFCFLVVFLYPAFLLVTTGSKVGKEENPLETSIFFSTPLLLIFLTFLSSLLLADNPQGGAGLLLPAAFSLSAFLGAGAALTAMAFCSDQLCWAREHRSFAHYIAGICLYALAGALVLGLLHVLILVRYSVWIPVLLGANIAGFKLWPAIKERFMSKKSRGTNILAEKLERWVVFLLVPALILLTVSFIGSLINHHLLDAAWVKSENVHRCWIAWIVLAVVIFVLSWLVNLNRLTPHYFYRDRLAEAFLRTVRRGETAAFEETTTILRDASEMPLVALHGIETKNDVKQSSAACAARGPYLLVNAAINLTATEDLKGFQRKADVFTFSRLFSGSEKTGYICTSAYDDGNLELSRVMTISGAAVTSIMGSLGTMVSSFACGIFGVRLGYWMANPRDLSGKKRLSRHRFWLWWFLLELSNYSHERLKLVYLSDGGHSGDNLGILPLLRRRTRLIIASDAEEDKEYLFDSLNSSLRQAYVDEGIKVDIDLSAFEKEEKKISYAVGRILYPDRPWQKSLLIVIKNCLTVDEKLATVKNYKKKSPDFPHETTGDQFFTEEQFESYRALGRHSVEKIFSQWYPSAHPQDPWKTLFEYCSKQMAGGSHRWDDVIRAISETDQGCFDSWEEFRATIEGYFAVEDPKLDVKEEAETQNLRKVMDLLRKEKDSLKLRNQYGFVPRTLPELKRRLQNPGDGSEISWK